MDDVIYDVTYDVIYDDMTIADIVNLKNIDSQHVNF